MVEENIRQFKNEIIEHFDKKTEEIKRHFDVAMGKLKNEIRVHIERIKKIRRAGFTTSEKKVSLIEAKLSR